MATLDQLISTLPTDSGQKGKAWERLCQWFLLNDPVYASQLRRALPGASSTTGLQTFVRVVEL
jgi:hypothetical protein